MKLQKNWHIVPLKEKDKLPLQKEWQRKATSDVATIKGWKKRWPNCSWGLLPSRSGLIAVDVDSKGLTEWKRLCKKHGEPKTLKAVSGSGRGLHYVFKHAEGRSYKGKLAPGIDVRFNNYIVIEPSIGKRRPYKWVNKIAPKTMPGWVAELIVKKKVAASQQRTVGSFDAKFFRPMIEELRQKDFGYDEWLQFGMALHHASGGDDAALDLYLELTDGVNYQPGDEALATSKWESFGENDGTPVTLGTFLKLAKDLGVRLPHNAADPEEYFDDESQEPDEVQKESLENQVKLDPKHWSKTKAGRLICEDQKELIRVINKEGYALLDGPRKAGSIVKKTSQDGVTGYVELSNQQFKNSVNHIALKQVNFSKDGAPLGVTYKDADKLWLQSGLRKRYRDIVFSPARQKGVLNLWDEPPIPCKPVKGPVGDILWYFKDVLASGCEDTYKYVVQWFAHLVQRPEQKPNVVLVIVGKEGTGKGYLTDGLMRGILRQRFTVVSNPSAVKNKFNKDLAFKFLITLDESCWQGDKELQGILRNRTGNRTLEVEEKFGARYEVEDFARMIITANTPDAVKLQSSNRRYLILENPDKYKEDPRFRKLWDNVKHGKACNHFYHYLRNVDLAGFHPNQFPKSIDRQGFATKVENDIVREFIIDAFIENPRPLFYEGKGVIKSQLFKEFQTFNEEIRGYQRQISQSKFTRELKENIPALCKLDKVTKIEGASYRVFRISPLEFLENFYANLRLGEVPEDFDEGALYY